MFRPFGLGRRQLTDYNEALLLDRFLIDGDEVGEEEMFQDRSQVECEEEEGEGIVDQRLHSTYCWPVNSLWALSSYTLMLGVYFVALFVPWELIFLGTRVQQDTMELPVKVSLHLPFLPLAIALRSALLLRHECHPCMEYLQFFRQVQGLVSTPHVLSSATNALILLSTQWPLRGYLHTDLGETHLLQIIVGVELLLMLIFCAVYMRHVTMLYGHTAPVHSHLVPIKSLLPSAYILTSSVRAGGSTRDRAARRDGLGAITPELAELILYMTRHITWLGRDVMQLEKKLALRNELSGADPPQAASADVQNLLQAREQQLRALMVEQAGLQKQQSIAWKMLDEKEAENNRLQINRQQHMDENNRLRATLREWSHRNAKLEQKLSRLGAELDSLRVVEESPVDASGSHSADNVL